MNIQHPTSSVMGDEGRRRLEDFTDFTEYSATNTLRHEEQNGGRWQVFKVIALAPTPISPSWLLRMGDVGALWLYVAVHGFWVQGSGFPAEKKAGFPLRYNSVQRQNIEKWDFLSTSAGRHHVGFFRQWDRGGSVWINFRLLLLYLTLWILL